MLLTVDLALIVHTWWLKIMVVKIMGEYSQCFEQCGAGLYRENAKEGNLENIFKGQEWGERERERERSDVRGVLSQNLKEKTISRRNNFEFYRGEFYSNLKYFTFPSSIITFYRPVQQFPC